MFELIEAGCTLTHKNDRLEKHGEESVLACDLNFEWETNNACLAMFAPELRSCMYKRAESAQLEIDPDPEHLTQLRFPGLAPLKWGLGDLVGAELTFHWGTSAKSNVLMTCQKVGKFKLDCREGGTVVVGFQASVRPTEQQAGRLSVFLSNGACQISVIPPKGDLHNDE